MVRLLLLLTLLGLSGCSVVNTLRMKSANDDILPSWPASQTLERFDAHYIGHKPYISVDANGQSLLFLIDTGASFTILFDTEKGRRVATQKGYELSVGGWGDGARTPAYQTNIETFNLGNVAFKNVKAAFIPLSESQYYHSEEEAVFDGVLGHDILRHFAWTFDKKAGVISASKTPILQAHSRGAIPFETFLGKLSIPVSVQFDQNHQYRREIVIDTGSRHYFKLNTAFIDNQDIRLPVSVTAADFGMSGRAQHQRFTLKQLTIGDNILNNVKTNVIESDDEDDWWIIGSALMNQYVSIIDYHTSQFGLLPYEGHTFSSLYNLSGIELRKLRDGNFIVRYVSPEFAAANLDVAIGDRVARVNEHDASALSEEDWLFIANQPTPIALCLTDNRCMTIPMSHITGYSGL